MFRLRAGRGDREESDLDADEGGAGAEKGGRGPARQAPRFQCTDTEDKRQQPPDRGLALRGHVRRQDVPQDRCLAQYLV